MAARRSGTKRLWADVSVVQRTEKKAPEAGSLGHARWHKLRLG
jgi:hypothetical protein